MPWQSPTLADVRKSGRDYIAGKLPGADATVPNSALRVISDANAGLADQVFDYIDWLALQLLPDTAVGPALRRWGTILFGGWKAATFASGSATLSSTVNVVVPAGSLLAQAGLQYQTTADVTLASGVSSAAPIEAVTAGVAGNLDPGTSLQLSTAIQGVNGTATVVSLTGGSDEESVDELRLRVLARIQKPPQGGDADDYVAWAREVPGVTRAWSSPREQGPGTVTVRFMMDDLRATSDPMTDGFPTADDVAVVQAHIDNISPVTADVFVVAPIPEPIDFTVSNLSKNSTSVQAAIAVSVASMLADRAAPACAENGAGIPAQTIFKAWVNAAILSADGVESFDLVMSVDHVMPSKSSMAVLGTITFASLSGLLLDLTPESIAALLPYLPTSPPNDPGQPWNAGGLLAFS